MTGIMFPFAKDYNNVPFTGSAPWVWERILKVKKLSDTAILPTKANEFDAGLDLYADQDCTLKSGQQELISTSIAMEIPDGYVGLIWPRSGLSAKHGIDVLAGVIDSGYRGEIKVCLIHNKGSWWKFWERNKTYKINKGDKIAQILIQTVPQFKVVETDTLSDSNRGAKGFGSSGT